MTFSVTPLSGNKFETIFTATISPTGNASVISWGDGTYSTTATATHTYSASNVYNVLISNCEASSAFSVSVENGAYLNNAINITYTDLSAYASCPNRLLINVSSISPHTTVFLYSSGSNALPYNSERTFWSHLNPEWSFSDIDGNVIQEIQIQGGVVSGSTGILGYTATSAIYYSDDMPGNPVLFFTGIFKEGDVEINSRVYAALEYSVSAQVPDGLCITSDGINPINEIQWAGINTPYVVSVCNSQNTCKTIMHYASGYLSQVGVLQGCNGVNPSNYQQFLSAIDLFDINCFPIGGYSINNFYLPPSAIPPITLSNNYNENACGLLTPDQIEFTETRHAPVGVVLSATAVIDVNGVVYNLSGVSNPFNVYVLENFNAFYRKGEDKNVYDLIKKYSHFDLDQLPTFNSYLSAIAGPGDTLGKTYDKITNFAKDHADLDVCTIENLQDKALKLDVKIDDYNVEYPNELQRYMDFFSIPLQKLIGTRCVCNNNFNCTNCCGKNVCTLCGFDKRTNVGATLTLNSQLNSGQVILIKQNGSSVYDFYSVNQTTQVRNLTGYPFDTIPVSNFCFNEWDASSQNNPVEGIVDYHNPSTTLNKGLTSNSDWYGDNGVVEEIINYILTSNLIDS